MGLGLSIQMQMIRGVLQPFHLKVLLLVLGHSLEVGLGIRTARVKVMHHRPVLVLVLEEEM
jgi:hypothetical protein